MAKNDKKKAGAPPPAPEFKPPARVVTRQTHGLARPPPNPTPIQRLRSVLQLSGKVDANTVIAEAATRLEQLLPGQAASAFGSRG